VSDQVKFVMDETHIPKTWYNLTADLPKPLPPVLHPGTKQPIGPADLEPLFPMELIMQEVSGERYIDIPQPVRDVYRMWRPSPLIRARRLEQKLGTPAKIYFKYEGVSPAGSHKPNTAVAQAWYNQQAGIKRLSTETGAGQWGSSLAFAGALFGIDVTVFQVRVSYDQKPYRRALMETYGARCIASPSNETDSGRAILKQHPDSPGSLGIAISEAVEVAAKDPAVKYSLGSVLNHVLLHQTIVGQERPDRGARLPPEGVLRSRRRIRALRRHRAGAGGQSRGALRHRRGAALQEGRQERDDPVQPVRPRPFRYAGLHRLLRGQTRRPGLR
jgi:tryptophan synthase beta chain